MFKDIFATHEDKMKKALEALRREYSSLRAGRATPALLDKVNVDYYGTPTPVNQVANVSVPEARMITIQPWEKTMLGAIEKAILKSDLGLNPNNDGTMIRLEIPQLTEERRKDLNKVVHKSAEDAKVAVRAIRRDAMEQLKKLQKDAKITEDEQAKAEKKMQETTDEAIKAVDELAAKKDKEIMEV